MNPRIEERARGRAGNAGRRTLRGCLRGGLLGVLGLLAGTAAPLPALASEGDVLIVGDSLAVGTHPFLSPLLAERNVVSSVRNGITTPAGMRLMRIALNRMDPATVVVSLGTNDGPDPRRFADRLRRTMSLLSAQTCVIWPTIIRPKRKGDYRLLNRVLHQEKRRDRRLVVINWEYAVRSGAAPLRDGLHATAAGYRHRSEMIAAAISNDCARPRPAARSGSGASPR
ncbi:MAG: SGNH/GDSL hydrolase family protein [Solirubrobacteraceae bacterium]|nr:SGNH/GDSL hydrolase family protein [Solirubrobacteraceae bacterium]